MNVAVIKGYKPYQLLSMFLVTVPIMLFAVTNPVPALSVTPPTTQKIQSIKDYGVQGHTFPIIERSLLEVIMGRLHQAEQSGRLATLQEQFKNRVKAKVMHPNAVRGIKHTDIERTFTFDPSITQKGDVKDHRGNLIVKDGTQVNPLDKLAWGRPWVFIDGDVPEHVTWALTQDADIILVKGAPLDLQAAHNHRFYFDQAGVLSHKFGIQQVPAIVAQKGNMLVIHEKKI